MEFVVAFDTNVLLKESDDCEDFIYELTNNSPPRFKIAVDSSQHILNEYVSVFAEEIERMKKERSSYLKDSLLGHIISLIETSGGVENAYVACLDADFKVEERDVQMAKLKNLGCDMQIEPALFGIARNYLNDAYIMTTKRDIGYKARGYTRSFDEIEKTYLQNNRKVRDSLRRLIIDDPCPDEYEALRRLLRAIEDYGKPHEVERCEFKREFNDDVRKGLPKEVCAMLNTDGGYIFIGIDEKVDGEGEDGKYKIRGFEWNQIAKDQNAAAEKIDSVIASSIRPQPDGKFKVKWVRNIPKDVMSDNNNNNMVVAIHVQKGTEEYCSLDKKGGKWRKFRRNHTKSDPVPERDCYCFDLLK